MGIERITMNCRILYFDSCRVVVADGLCHWCRVYYGRCNRQWTRGQECQGNVLEIEIEIEIAIANEIEIDLELYEMR